MTTHFKISLKNILLLVISSAVLLFSTQSCSASQKTTSKSSPVGSIQQKSVLNTITEQNLKPEEASATADQPKQIADSVNVDSLLAEMSLKEKIGQLFFVRAYGYYKSNDSETYQKLLRQIQNYHIGGVVFFNGTVYGQAILTNKLQRASKLPLWVTQDMEYGAAMRIDGTTRFVPAMGIAATQKPDYAYWMGKVTAQEATALGVNQIFAPVLDVNNNPLNPVINVRSFSGDPDIVSKFGNKFIEGAESENVLPTAKHFPGHGDTDIDSHLSLPVIEYDFARLDSVELVPFRSAINNGLKSVMSAHISFPALSPDSSLPATMDPSVLNRILADSLNFDGLVVSDGLEMQGISSHFSPGQAVIQALKAGVDLMLLSPDELTALHEIEQAVGTGKISEKRIDNSVRKLLKWKKQQGLFENREVDIESLSANINTRKNRLIADEISRKSLTLLKNNNDILPIRASEYPKVMVVSVSDGKSGYTGSSFVSQLRDYHPDISAHLLDRRTSKEEKQEMIEDARKADLIIIGSFIYVKSGEKVQLDSEQLSFLKKLTKNKPSILTAFGNPYVVQDLPDTDVQLLAWSANGGQVKSTVPALFGGSEISGRLPISIPGLYSINHGLYLPQTAVRYDEPEVSGLSRDSLRNIDRIMNEAIFDSTFPGGVVTVVKDGNIAYQKGFGYETYEKLNPIKEDAVYDLASLTKVTATTVAVMKLVEEGKISLKDKIGKYIPEFSEGKKKNITIANFLLHNSGLPPFRVYVDSLKSEEEIIEAIKTEPLTYKTGSDYRYSDLGFILLAEIVEQVSGKPLDQYVREKFYYPLGMSSTFFNPKQVGNHLTTRIPPTEIDTVYRDTTIRAEVHDERAYFLNGVAGHAGLFSSGKDLAIFCQMLLNDGWYAGRRYLEPSTIEKFTKRQAKHSNRGYGFDRKSGKNSTAGSLTSEKTFGHLGFTGTSYWIDPERDLAIIILTNRTYPYRSYGENISTIRAKVADAVVSSIIE
ncbi:glycoside hydrolase family 3 N-terminal domain-containing protein [Fodinibius sp. AD559]|uniref:glycoside hydrolase family 3 N-terminal domain-containing protein n=1 Tax=Fodinibius sp. AD559 TaxID=3424179 RepID=UPI004046CA10